MRDILALGEATDHDAPNIVTHLVALGIDMLACEVAREIGAHLQVSAATPSHGTLPAQREQVLSLVRLLLDDSSYREGLRRAAFGERLIRIDAAPDIAKELWGDAAFALVPLSQLTVMRSCGEMTSMADAAEDLNWWTAVRKIAPYETTGWRSRLEVFSQEPALFIGFSSYRPLQMHFAQMGTRRMTAILLALRLYEIDHGGNLPESLAQLVPEYLPRVPADPFRSDNSALGYLPRRVPPAVYSVGYDGRDQGASEKLPAGQSKRASSTPWDFEDAVFPLRRALTSTDTQDNQGEVGESQRKKSQDQNE